MRLLVTGKNGQVGWELQRSLQCLGEIVAVDRSEFDLSQPASLTDQLDVIAPDVIVNAAAYTAVDHAEQEEDLATMVNGIAPGTMARWAISQGAFLVHYSTDYVFDGSGDRPWTEKDQPAPLSAYGRSKLAGEHALAASGCDYLILRTSWVYAARGRNFLATIRRLAGERKEIRIVDDQFGAPTSARLVADATSHAIRTALSERRMGVFRSDILHMAASGSTSWHGFASTIVEHLRNSASGTQCQSVTPISTSEYPTPARRPTNSRLDCTAFTSRFGLALSDWRVSLGLCLNELSC